MENSYKYNVAGHVFEVVLPEGASEEACLQPYVPFRYSGETRPLFRLRMEYAEDFGALDPGPVKECLNDEAPYFWMFEREDGFNFGFSYSKSRPDCILIPSGDFADSVVYVPAAKADRLAEFALSNAMMLLYTFRTTPYETLMVHASVIRHAEGGYMFLGRSGTGKSTHSRLWLSNIDDAVLLNDDNPIVRIVDGEALVYGSPWSGKTSCYVDESAPIAAMVRLFQAPENRFTRKSDVEAFSLILPGASVLRFDEHLYGNLCETLIELAGMVCVGEMRCLPDKDAARICREGVE